MNGAPTEANMGKMCVEIFNAFPIFLTHREHDIPSPLAGEGWGEGEAAVFSGSFLRKQESSNVVA